jgi:hypothetical protein
MSKDRVAVIKEAILNRLLFVPALYSTFLDNNLLGTVYLDQIRNLETNLTTDTNSNLFNIASFITATLSLDIDRYKLTLPAVLGDDLSVR